MQQQPFVVALMQADRGLIEDVHDADQAGADLAREPDALRFAARQRFGAAIERQVVEADVAQEAQALADFLDDLAPRFRRASLRACSSQLKRSASPTDERRECPADCVSATNTLRAARFRRVPPHSGQG